MNKQQEDNLRDAIRLLMPGLDTTKLYSVFCSEICCQPKKDALERVCAFLNDDSDLNGGKGGGASHHLSESHLSTKQSAPQSWLARGYWRLFPLQGRRGPADGIFRTAEIKPRRFLGWVVR